MEVRMAPTAVVLLSGGLDSSTTLAMAIGENFECHALTVDYGQRNRVEMERAKAQAVLLGAASHRIARVDLAFAGGSALTDDRIEVPKSRSDPEIASGVPVTYVPARNTVFLAVALSWAEALGAADIFTGVNAVDYSGYPDCRPAFLEAFEALAGVATAAGVAGRRFKVHAPLLRMSKGEIVARAVEKGVDLALTFSCYDPRGDRAPCGECDACRLRQRGFMEAGIEDPTRL